MNYPPMPNFHHCPKPVRRSTQPTHPHSSPHCRKHLSLSQGFKKDDHLLCHRVGLPQIYLIQKTSTQAGTCDALHFIACVKLFLVLV